MRVVEGGVVKLRRVEGEEEEVTDNRLDECFDCLLWVVQLAIG